jgi:hypothetical protein
MVGVILGVLLTGVGLVLALFGADMGMPESQGMGIGLVVVGVIVLVASVILFGWMKR